MIETKKKKKKTTNKQTNKQKKKNKSKELNMVWLDSLCPLQKALGNYIFAYETVFFFLNNESNVKFI